MEIDRPAILCLIGNPQFQRESLRPQAALDRVRIPDPSISATARPMSTKTHTTTTHYHIQKKRRAEFIEEWRKYRQTVIRKEDVALVPTARGLRTGVYMGWDGDRPTRCLDALVHEIDPGTATTIHRHSWDAISSWSRERLDRGRRRPLRLEAVGRDPHPGVELAPARQRRRPARAAS